MLFEMLTKLSNAFQTHLKTHPVKRILVTIIIIIGAILWVIFCDLKNPEAQKKVLADLERPIEIIIQGDNISSNIGVVGVALSGSECLPNNNNKSNPSIQNSKFKNKFITGVKIRIKENALAQISNINVITIHKSYKYSIDTFRKKWPAKTIESHNRSKMFEFSSPADIYYNRSSFLKTSKIINWPGDYNVILCMVKYAFKYCIYAIIIYMLILYILIAFKIYDKESNAHKILLFDGNDGIIFKKESSAFNEIIWFIIGFLFICLSFMALEIKQPYYFTQDDNFQEFMPTMVQSCRSVIIGVLPTWNPYIQMGEPTIDIGIYALTYPITYLSYFFARYVLHSEYLLIEVFAIFHLVLGYIVTWFLLRKVGFYPFLATLGSLSFILSGYFLIVGRSWYYMTPTALYFPLLIYSIVTIKNNLSLIKWVIFTGLTIGLYFHSGNVQMWTYGMCFYIFGIILMVITKTISGKRSLIVIPAILFGLTLSTPLLYPLINVMNNSLRVGGDGTWGIYEGLVALFLPYPIALSTGSFGNWCNLNRDYIGQMYYGGSVFSFISLSALIAVVFGLIHFRFNMSVRRILKANIWIICAGLAFVFALGDRGVAWLLMSKLPVFRMFNIPLKFLPFLNLFLCLGGGTVFMRYLYNLKNINLRKASVFSIVFSVLILLAYHVSLPLPSFYTYKVIPYPELPIKLSQLLRNNKEQINRVISFTDPVSREGGEGINLFLHWNYPSIYSIHSLDGYNPIIQATPQTKNLIKHINQDPVTAANAYGVRWLLIQDENSAYLPINRNVGLIEQSGNGLIIMQSLLLSATKLIVLKGASLWELKQYSPMAFSPENPFKTLILTFSGNSFNVDTSKLLYPPLSIVANILWRPNIIASDNNGRILVTAQDEYGRVKINMIKPAKSVHLTYSPPFGMAIKISLLLLLITVFSYYLIVIKFRLDNE